MNVIKDIIKWSVILFVATVLVYIIFPKYQFSGPSNFPFYRCNTITGEIMAWDYVNEKWTDADKNSIVLNCRIPIK